ncbi:MAG: glucosidase [Mycobacteriales bacterium]
MMGDKNSSRRAGDSPSVAAAPLDPERARLAEGAAWRAWGPYLAERAWGTVREDYSADGEAWDYFPHDHARSRAYRWSEDGLAGVCDDHQRLCLAFAFWNGVDPILKERIFGLAGGEGNHGEDAKEYWWYNDATPTHSWLRWQYAYPQAAFPYEELVAENRRRGVDQPEFELADTAVLDAGFWDITVDYAKSGPDDICARVSVVNRGPATATLEVLPTLWFRNVWSWGIDDVRSVKPVLAAGTGATIVAEHPVLGRRVLVGSNDPELLFCENESNVQRLWGAAGGTAYPKDGINDCVVHGAATVNPGQTGTKAALRYRLTLPSGGSSEIRLRLSAAEAGDLGSGWSRCLHTRQVEADAFYAQLLPGVADEDAAVARQAWAGMLWGKQFYHYNVARWLRGDPAGPAPSEQRLRGRNASWSHLDNFDIISMPDTWEYPWYASWDLAFHCVALAHVDPTFAKEQLLLLCREWYMHPNGQLPAYEWSFDDVNPPVHAWAALRVFEIDGSRDLAFLKRIFHKLPLNFTWWVNREDIEGNNVFQGGFLGLDNIGPLNRSAALPVPGHREQSDATAWMAMYCLNLLEIALVLAADEPTYQDLATKFFEHFAHIAAAIHSQGLWDDDDGFYYDVLHLASGDRIPIKARSMVGLIPLAAVMTLSQAQLERLPEFRANLEWFVANKPEYAEVIGHCHEPGAKHTRLLSIANPERLARVLTTMLDDDEFLSPYGLRSLSRYHQEHPFLLSIGSGQASVGYEPAESASGMFGGNSNWRGPVWFPLNYLIIDALRQYGRFFGEDFTVELPVRSGQRFTLAGASEELAGRLLALFLPNDAGRRPAHAEQALWGPEGPWPERLLFYEYFHGDTGVGLGASHQTGWTGLVADIVARRAGHG